MSGLGFKALSIENWLEPEPFLSVIKTLSAADGTIIEISREQWLNRFLKPQLNAVVPFEIRKLFEVARGAATYGYFLSTLHACWPFFAVIWQVNFSKPSQPNILASTRTVRLEVESPRYDENSRLG